MTVHTDHPPISGHGLDGDCLRCAELAEKPIAELDDGNLLRLLHLAVDPNRLALSRSESEAVASAHVLTALERAGRLARLDPQLFVTYLRRQWGVVLEVHR